jgi:hypothetical protein
MAFWARFFAPTPNQPRDPAASGLHDQIEKVVGEVMHSVGIRARVLDRDHLLTIARSLNERAVREKDLGHYELAKALCQRALDIFDKTVADDHPQLADILENYASILQQEAADLKARASAIRANLPDPRFPRSPQPDTRIQK